MSHLLRTAVAAALAAWLPGALLATLLQAEVWDGFLETHLDRLAEEVDEAIWTARELEAEARGEDPEEEDLEGREVDTPGLEAALDDLEVLGEPEICVRLEGPDGETAVNIEEANIEVLREERVIHSGVAVIRARFVGPAAEEELDDPETWCLVRRLELADGGRLLVGHAIGGPWERVRRGELLRNGLWALGLPLVLGLGWLQTRPRRRFLDALAAVAGRQAAGDVRARLHAEAFGGETREAAAAVDRMLDRLEQQAQTLSRVGDSIAHDLRTPLARLQGQLDLLKQSSEPRGELIDAIQDEADQLLSTFNALLRIAQIESGARTKGFRRFDFAQVVENVAELYAPVFAEEDVAFTYRLPRGRIDRDGDGDLWTQALSNLVENALKYTPAEGRVDLELGMDGERVRLVLSDSGPGIPEAERDNVFRRFYRLERHRGEKGSGLGLALVAAVCELHGAEIRLGGTQGLVVEVTY